MAVFSLWRRLPFFFIGYVPRRPGAVEMRTLNVRLLVVLLFIGLLVSAAAYAVHGYQVRRNADDLWQAAKSAESRNERALAIDLFQRYVALVPTGNVEALADLGMLLSEAGQVTDAHRILEHVLRLDSSRNEVRRRTVDMALELGRFQDVQHHLTVLLKTSPDDSSLHALMARSHAALSQPSDAAKSYRAALELAPNNVLLYGELAELTRSALKDPLAALDVLDEMVRENPELALAYVVRGRHYLDHSSEIVRARAGKLPSAEDDADDEDSSDQPTATEVDVPQADDQPEKLALRDARSALERQKDDQEVIVFAVRCLMVNDLPDEAREIASRGLEQYPKTPFLYGSLADLDRKAGDLPGAISWFERGLQAIPNEVDLSWNLADTLIDVGRYGDAERELAKLKTREYPKPPIAYLEAKILSSQKKWFEASHQFESLRAVLIDWPELAKQADLYLGLCYQQLGRNDLQLTAYRRAATVDSRWVPARLGVASGLLATGKLEEALEEYRQIAALPGASTFVLAQLARVAILTNLQRNESERNWRQVEALVDRLEELDRESIVVPLLRAEILVAQEKLEEASELVAAARDRSPESAELWQGLVSLAELQADEAKARGFIDEYKRLNGDTVAARLMDARHSAMYQRASAQEKLRELSQNVAAFSEEETTELYAGLAGWTLGIGDYNETERLCTIVAERQPTNLRIRLLLFDLAYRAAKLSAMERILEQLHQIERSGPLWHYGTAVRLAVLARENKSPELYVQAKQHLTEARSVRPTWARIPVLLGRISDAMGDEDGALANYSQAIEFGERSPEIVGRLVRMLYQRRRFLQADQVIRKLQEQKSPFSTQLTQLATAVSLRLRDRERTLSFVTQAAKESDDPEELIWAARILGGLGKNDEAEVNFRQAIKLYDDSEDTVGPADYANAWVALIQHLGRTAQLNKAEEALKEATAKIPPGEAPLALAQALESIGRFADAETQYRAALESAPDEIPLMRRVADFWLRRNQPDDADPLLQRILKMDAATEDDLVWCRRSLSVILIARPTPANLKQSLELIKVNLELDPQSAPDRRAKALALAQMSDPESLNEAAQILESVLQEEAADGDESKGLESRFVLAKVYVALKDHPKALQHLRTLLVAKERDEPRYLAYYAKYLISRQEMVEAERWVNRLASVDPQNFEALALAAEIRFGRGQFAELLRSIENDAAKPIGTPIQQQERRRQAAFLLEDFSHRLKRATEESPGDAAEKRRWKESFLNVANTLIKKFEELQPDGTLALSAFYARNGKFDDSLNLLEKNLGQSRIEEIAAVTGTAISMGTATKEQLARIERLLRQSVDTHKRPLVLLLALADHLNWTGKYSEAEQLYREALIHRPDNLAALNNLAVLLALQGKSGGEPLKLIEQAISLAGAQAVLLDSRGTVLLAMGDTDRAGKDFRRAIALQPTRGGYFRLALVELNQGNQEAARTSLAKARELGLRAETLHPLERPLLEQLEFQLK